MSDEQKVALANLYMLYCEACRTLPEWHSADFKLWPDGSGIVMDWSTHKELVWFLNFDEGIEKIRDELGWHKRLQARKGEQP